MKGRGEAVVEGFCDVAEKRLTVRQAPRGSRVGKL